MNGLRRFLFPIRLARARLGTGRERLLLVAVGVVAGSAALAAVLSGRLVMQDRSLALATAQLSPSERSLEVAWFGALSGNWRALDREVTQALGRPSVRVMLYRESQIDGRLVNLRAANDLGAFVRLRSGHLPTTCVPSHCEVLRLQGAGVVPSTPGLRLIQVGTATLERSSPFAQWIEPVESSEVARAVRYHTPQPSPVLIANGVDGMARTPVLNTFFRSYAWFVPIQPGDVHPWSVGAYAQYVDDVRAELGARSPDFEVTGPTDSLTSAVSSSQVAARRLLLLGGETGALLLTFTILAAATLRRSVAESRRRLLWAGARRWQVELHTFAETGAVAVGGTIAGWCLGGAIAALVASDAGSPAWQVIRHSLLTGGGIAAAACVAAAAGLLLYLTVRAEPLDVARFGITPLDVAALAALATVAVGWARGSITTSNLSGGGGGGIFVLLVPALVTFAVAVGAVRLLLPGLRALGRVGKRGPISLRLASLSLARNPGQATVVATFLVASLGLALFAVTYRSTLLQGEHDQAYYAEPAPYVADEDLSQLIPVLHGWHGAPATQILRLYGNVLDTAGFTLLGIRDPKLALHASAFVSTKLPAGTTFSLPVWTHGDDVFVRAWFRSPLGDFQVVTLGETHGMHHVVLSGAIPFAGATLSSLELDVINSGRLTANGGTGLQPTARGTFYFGTPSVDGHSIPHAFAGWQGHDGLARRGGSLEYTLLTGSTSSFRPHQPTDGIPLPVLATPAVAHAADKSGIVALSIEGTPIAARIVGTIPRFESVDGDAVIADRVTAETLLDSQTPGLGTTDELWADRLPPHGAPDLTVVSRAQVLAGLRADPLARGALLTLAATAGLALALALVGLLLGVAGDRRDERGELFDLEAQGASPAMLRTHLRLRALLVAGFGLAGGIAAGAILSRLVLSLVSVTASAAEPEPPLRLVLSASWLAAAIGGYALLAFVLVVGATRFRGRTLERASEAAT